MDIEVKNFVCIECGKAFDKNQKMLLHHRMTHILWKNPEFIKLRKESVKKQWEDDSFKEKMLPILKNNSKENWKRDDYRKERSKISTNIMLNNWKNESFKKIMSESNIEKWKCPEKRTNLIRKFKEASNNSRRKSIVAKTMKKYYAIPGNRETASARMKNKWNDQDCRKQMIEDIKKNKGASIKRLKDLWANPLYREKMSKMSKELAKKISNDPEIRKQRSINAKKQWGNPVVKNNMVKAMLKASCLSPNKCEQSLQQILNELYPNEYKFVGDGEVVIGGFCPDFINCNGKKLIVEFDGNYWHSSEKTQEKDQRKLAKYKELGFDTLVVKENEFKNDKEGVKNRIVEFVKNYEKEHYGLLV